MKFTDYQREIELIKKQNNVEYDLYDLIASLLKECILNQNISVRNVSNRRRSKFRNGDEQVLWGLAGFPDFVLLDGKYVPQIGVDHKDMIYGVVEAKYVGCPMLEKIGDIRQLKGHLLWFGTVIYTNGIEWRIYLIDQIDHIKAIGEIREKQNESYNISGTLAEQKRAYNTINQFLDSCKLPKPKKYILQNNDIWDKEAWTELVQFLKDFNCSTK